MPIPYSPARLHVFLAREAPTGLILRRGPSKQVCTIGWNRTDDTFQLGQWLKGRIYEHRCDLSPDGRHFLYMASKQQDWNKPDRATAWTAVSRAPYLKAVAFWEQDSTYGGGGQFMGDRLTCRDDVQSGIIQGPDNLPHPSKPYLWGDIHLGKYHFRLRREGWQPSAASSPETEVWEKKHADWTLHQFMPSGLDNPVGRGVYWQWIQAQHLPTSETLGDQSWEWADFDGDRLVWAQAGKLFATQIWNGGHGDILELADFNDWTFQPIQAPY